MSKVYITGDKHGILGSVNEFCRNNNTTKEDILIILGDVGLNYCDTLDEFLRKKHISKNLPITLLCIHGNHDNRPKNCVLNSSIDKYVTREWHGGTVYYQSGAPTILFAEDGEVFTLAGHKCLIVGGAYSHDKNYRITNNLRWFNDEQPDGTIINRTLDSIDNNPDIEVILTHTCPLELMPPYPTKDEDQSTEKFLSEVARCAPNYKKWYCGHHHIDRVSPIDQRLRFMYHDFEELSF